MKAVLILRRRYVLDDDAFAEIVIWKVPKPVPTSAHDYKYALAFVVGDECVLRYDNEAGKGDHRHVGGVEAPYRFTTPGQLIADFRRDVDAWRTR